MNQAGADLRANSLTNQKVLNQRYLLFYDIHFRRTNPKIFLKAPWAPIYFNFEGERAPKTLLFW